MTQRHREDFIARLAKAGVSPDDARKLLRYARTLHRLAEAQCNGDWPYQPGTDRREIRCCRCDADLPRAFMVRTAKRAVDLWNMPHPGKPWPKSSFMCKGCATEVNVAKLLCNHGVTTVFSGDPRGCVLKVRIPGDPGDYGDGLVGVP